MIEVISEIKTRLEVILAGELFDDPAGGDSLAMVSLGGLAPKRSGAQNDEDFPFVVVRSMTGSDSDRNSGCSVHILAGIFTDGNIVAGLTDIDRLVGLVCSLRENRFVAGHRLLQDISWRYGDKDGLQQDPYYYATIALEFTRDKKCTEV